MTNKKILTLISLLLILFLLVGCKTINQPPVITSTPAKTATVEVEYIYDVNATDPNTGDVLTYSLDDEPTGMVINGTSGVITWTPTATGSVEFTVVVTDEGGLFDDQDVTITVSEFVKELIGIEVDPPEMTLPLDTIGTFEVTAHYNDVTLDEEVTGSCDYASSDNSIATVEVGVVTPVAEGTATISAFYKGEKDTLKVTVTDYLPMEIIADMPTFTAEVEAPFTITTVANSDVGKTVLSYFTLPAGVTITYGETTWTEGQVCELEA